MRKDYKETLCWTCNNAYAHHCRWIKRCEPIPGWEAEKTLIRNKSKSEQKYSNVPSYMVVGCPNYVHTGMVNTNFSHKTS